MANEMKTSRASLARLLTGEHIRDAEYYGAARVVGKRLRLDLVDAT